MESVWIWHKDTIFISALLNFWKANFIPLKMSHGTEGRRVPFLGYGQNRVTRMLMKVIFDS